MKDEKIYLAQILDSIKKIEAFTYEMTKESFISDQKTQSAVIMQLALIGEISRKLTEQFKESINIPWKAIINFRNKAVHDYFGIDIEIIWKTVVDDIPTLKSELNKIKL